MCRSPNCCSSRSLKQARRRPRMSRRSHAMVRVLARSHSSEFFMLGTLRNSLSRICSTSPRSVALVILPSRFKQHGFGFDSRDERKSASKNSAQRSMELQPRRSDRVGTVRRANGRCVDFHRRGFAGELHSKLSRFSILFNCANILRCEVRRIEPRHP